MGSESYEVFITCVMRNSTRGTVVDSYTTAAIGRSVGNPRGFLAFLSQVVIPIVSGRSPDGEDWTTSNRSLAKARGGREPKWRAINPLKPLAWD